MFWLWFIDLACRTAQEDPLYRGFNKETINLLNEIEESEGFFAQIKK